MQIRILIRLNRLALAGWVADLSRLVVGSSRAMMPQVAENVSASASLMMREASTFWPAEHRPLMSISVPFFTITTLQPETDYLPETRNKSTSCHQKQITTLKPITNHLPATRNRSPSCNQKQITTLQSPPCNQRQITFLQPETNHHPATRNRSPSCNQKQITTVQPETYHLLATRNKSPPCNKKQITTLQLETDHLPATCRPDTGPLIYPFLEKAAKTPPSFATNQRKLLCYRLGYRYYIFSKYTDPGPEHW